MCSNSVLSEQLLVTVQCDGPCIVDLGMLQWAAAVVAMGHAAIAAS